MHKNSNGTIFCCEFVSTIGLSTIKCINYDKSTSLKYMYILHNEKSQLEIKCEFVHIYIYINDIFDIVHTQHEDHIQALRFIH